MRSASLFALFLALTGPVTFGARLGGLMLQSGGDGPVGAMNSWEYVDCGSPTDAILLQSLKVSPDPPQPGEELTVFAKGRVQKEIKEGAYANVVVKLGVIKLLQKQFDVCEEARNTNATIRCPVKEDDYTVQQTVTIPTEVPRAKFLVQVRGFTVEEEDMLCVDLKIDFMPRIPYP
ncbi:hypothetical protein BS47DRAFT_1343887 [Hydnum rufescens UP504]|uniref:Phosphatidylglycerol/phosphatidylinositol transfer protein n=1 Tax=Hydnum rufescens UP504 TaxID=1448309 RepID=A0A9P6AXS3_9AGAM|nr:hypothetical protein BS47DRAFT_1343887 [Hydnum rufescens UP504]